MASVPTHFFRFLMASALLTPLPAQVGAPTPVYRGRVLDPSGAPIAGAHAIAISVGATSGPAADSGSEGRFSLTLEPGSYVLNVAKDGFLPVTREIRVGPGNASPDDIELQVAPVRTSVTVTESPGYLAPASTAATKTLTPLLNVPQSVSVVTREVVQDQMMMSMGDVVRYMPGITAIQGENNRDQLVIRGNSSSADFFVDGVRDDVQYYRDLYNVDRVEALKGSNAMIFGRGGGGGVINQVTKQADFMNLGEISLQGGSYGNKRFAADLDHPLNDKLAFRLNGMFEDSDSFRRYVNLRRYAVNPTLTFTPTTKTRIMVGYEHLRDNRVADRGISSFQGRPAQMDISTYFGDPHNSNVHANVNVSAVTVEQQVGRLMIRNHTSIGDYNRGYQNFVPGIVSADQTQVALSAYNNATQRRNIFNQTDFTYAVATGRIRHTLLAGVEVGRQLTSNFRNTGYFNNTATSIMAPYADPTITVPVVFRQSATDANNHLKVNLGAAYIQDQIELSRYLQVVAGVRFDYFDLQYHDNRSGNNLRRIDNLVSPRTGIIFKPATAVSVYATYSVSYLPSSGDQFSSLTNITQQAKPEKFNNYETGVKWDILRDLSVTAAVYRLDRTNTRATDPNNPTAIVQTGSQRTNGFELGLTGSVTRKWKLIGGYAYQDAFVTSATTAARTGAQVAQVPHHSFSLWNNYQIAKRWGAGLGLLNRTDMYAGIDDTVTLPGYTRADAAVFYSLSEKVRLQANVENLFDTRYYLNADNNTNISPGSPRALRIGLIAKF
ncbi:MAG: TonB-dependent siderophore receptor [Acidobacteriota bacterium]